MRECYNPTCKALEYEAEIESLKKQLQISEEKVKKHAKFLNRIYIDTQLINDALKEVKDTIEVTRKNIRTQYYS